MSGRLPGLPAAALALTAALSVADVRVSEGPVATAPRPIVYAWFPANLDDWSTAGLDWSVLTHVCFRAVILQPDGTVRPSPQTTDARVQQLVEEAHAHGVKVCVLAWGTTARNADRYLARCPERTVQSLLAYVQAHHLDGGNIDDETWRAVNEDAGGFNRWRVADFFHELRSVFKRTWPEYHLSWASPPVISPEDRYGVAWPDYAAAARELDALAIMAYALCPPSIGWTGADQPVRGGGFVGTHPRDVATVVADYAAATQGRKDTLLLGINSLYGGWEWRCRKDSPHANIIGRGRRLSPTDAAAGAAKWGRRWDPVQRAPWYVRRDGKDWRQAWYEDDESFAAKVALTREEGLGGIALWVVGGMDQPPTLFPTLARSLEAAPASPTR